ncbi:MULTISPECIES: hypothetical protein [unclassified Methylobacterium]|uniref:hypothetical protein n=1 Tax=unclassified Methylobacterium TaxID=2615210 RepID=UPI0006F43920|nr:MULTISPECIES: hypothetical protein [unclassified Methylobacterium]KQO49520.1 hypothetical protein ASF24_08895 [Methylobacterium sp. Leaf86]KQP00811.1 hypothetical protein ASF32_01060 [Methylobacterium sp. Leaf91]
MKARLLGALLTLVATAGAANAAPRTPGHAHAAMAPLERAATDCFAETVMANPAAMRHARAGRWYEAAGIIGFLCRPEVDAMIRTHDRLFGNGTGQRYFKAAYTRHLGGELAMRLQPMLERTAVATAEPPADRTAPETGDKAQ